MLEHEAVETVGVAGVPDETRGNIVKALVVPAEAAADPAALRGELTSFARRILSKHEYPREIEFVESHPETETGNIKRSALERLAVEGCE